MAQGDQPGRDDDGDMKAEGDEQLDEVGTEHLDVDPEKGPPPPGYGGKPGEPHPGGGEADPRSTGRTVP